MAFRLSHRKSIGNSPKKIELAKSGRISRVDAVPSSLCAFCKRINVFEVVRRKEGRTTPLYRATTTTPDRRTCFRVRRQLKASLCNGRRSSGHWVCISLVLPTVSFPPSPSLSLSPIARLERERERGRERSGTSPKRSSV